MIMNYINSQNKSGRVLMKKLVVFIIVALVFISCSKQKEVIQVKDLNDLLEKHFKAIGIEKLKNCNNIILGFDTNAEPIPRNGKTITCLLKLQKPNSTYVLGAYGKDTLNYFVSNGKEIPPQNTPGQSAENNVNDESNHFNYYLLQYSFVLAPLYGVRQMQDSIEFLGKMNIDNIEVYRVKTIRKNNNNSNVVTIYDLDPYTMLILRAKTGENSDYLYYNDYDNADGFQFSSYVHMKD